MTELIKITEENGNKLVSAKELHKFLESKQDFTTWIKARIDKYGFIENEDFTLHKFMVGKSIAHDYILKMSKKHIGFRLCVIHIRCWFSDVSHWGER